MRAQLKHLLEITDLPNVTLQIVPFTVGPHAAAGQLCVQAATGAASKDILRAFLKQA